MVVSIAKFLARGIVRTVVYLLYVLALVMVGAEYFGMATIPYDLAPISLLAMGMVCCFSELVLGGRRAGSFVILTGLALFIAYPPSIIEGAWNTIVGWAESLPHLQTGLSLNF